MVVCGREGGQQDGTKGVIIKCWCLCRAHCRLPLEAANKHLKLCRVSIGRYVRFTCIKTHQTQRNKLKNMYATSVMYRAADYIDYITSQDTLLKQWFASEISAI